MSITTEIGQKIVSRGGELGRVRVRQDGVVNRHVDMDGDLVAAGQVRAESTTIMMSATRGKK